MKYKLFAVLLALLSVAWAQTAQPSAPAQNPNDQAKASCCGKSGAKSACGDHCMRNKDAKTAMSCCAGENAANMKRMACMRNKSDKTASADCKNCCKADKKMSCCSAKGDKSAMNSCGDHCMRNAAATPAM